MVMCFLFLCFEAQGGIAWVFIEVSVYCGLKVPNGGNLMILAQKCRKYSLIFDFGLSISGFL